MSSKNGISFKGSVKTLLSRRIQLSTDWETSAQAIIEIFGSAPIAVRKRISDAMRQSVAVETKDQGEQESIEIAEVIEEPPVPTQVELPLFETNLDTEEPAPPAKADSPVGTKTQLVKGLLGSCYTYRHQSPEFTTETASKLFQSLKQGAPKNEVYALIYQALKERYKGKPEYQEIFDQWESESYILNAPRSLYGAAHNIFTRYFKTEEIRSLGQTPIIKWMD